MLTCIQQANVTPTAIPKSGPSNTSTSKSAVATAMSVDGRLGMLGLGMVAAGIVLG